MSWLSLHKLTLAELQRKFTAGDVTATEIVRAYNLRVTQVEPKVNAYLTHCREAAIEQAARLDQALKGWRKTAPMMAMPLAVKDNICTAGVRTTCASRMLETFVPPYDATVIARLREQGCLLFGKTNLDEFAMGSSTENSAFGASRNPWDLHRVPGGSSGGSAAAVAADECVAALGSDTGGSIRQPAAFCGVVGLKPTYGRVSRYGLVAFASSLDQIGPFARNVEDAALLAQAISGHDPSDSTSLPDSRIDISDMHTGTLRGLRLAAPRELLGEACQPGVHEAVEATLDRLRREGAEVREISLPSVTYGVTTYYIIAPAEASSNLARFDGVRYGPRLEGEGHIGAVAATRGQLFGHEVKARIMIGTYALSAGYYDAYYVRAQRVRARMTAEFEAALSEFDAIVSPTSPVVAFPLGEMSRDPLALKMLDLCTIPANMGGFPAISLPCGLSEGLPVGLQLVGPICGDERLLQIAYSVERALAG